MDRSGPSITFQAHGYAEKQISVFFFVQEVWTEERNEDYRMKNWFIGRSLAKSIAHPSQLHFDKSWLSLYPVGMGPGQVSWPQLTFPSIYFSSSTASAIRFVIGNWCIMFKEIPFAVFLSILAQWV